jgi:hypothetical protein
MHRLGQHVVAGMNVGTSPGTPINGPMATPIRPPSQTPQQPQGPLGPSVLPTAPGGGTIVNSGGQQ